MALRGPSELLVAPARPSEGPLGSDIWATAGAVGVPSKDLRGPSGPLLDHAHLVP